MCFILKIEYQILAIFDNYIIKYIMSKQDLLLEILNFSELKSLANNAKIRSWLKFLLIQYFNKLYSPNIACSDEWISLLCLTPYRLDKVENTILL